MRNKIRMRVRERRVDQGKHPRRNVLIPKPPFHRVPIVEFIRRDEKGVAHAAVIWILQDPVTGDVFMAGDRQMIAHAKECRLHWTVDRVVLRVPRKIVTRIDAAGIPVRKLQFQSNFRRGIGRRLAALYPFQRIAVAAPKIVIPPDEIEPGNPPQKPFREDPCLRPRRALLTP